MPTLAACVCILMTSAANAENGTMRLSSISTTQPDGNVSTETITYDNNGFISSTDSSAKTAFGTTTVVRIFTYDEFGQISKIVNDMAVSGNNSTETTDFKYDTETHRRLLSAQTQHTNGEMMLELYGYDDDGRLNGITRTTKGVDSVGYSEEHILGYDQSGYIVKNEINRIENGKTFLGGYSVTYDNQGRMISYIDEVVSSVPTTATIAYMDDMKTVVNIVVHDNQTAVTYNYENATCKIMNDTDGLVVHKVFQGPGLIGFIPICK